ncbi:ELM1/GtrOC1 family putative glycosyltransferase [Candidatus Omnitrophota bacterium]
MNKHSIIDFLGFIIVKIANAVFCCIPLGMALWIGRLGGGLALLVNSKRRSIAYANLKSAFPEKNTSEIKKILKSHFKSLGMSIVELLRLPVMGKRYLDRHVTVSGLEKIKKELDKGKGVILLSAHFGNWEVSSLAVNVRGHKMSVFVREQKYTRLNNLLNKYREMAGSKVITKGFSVREIVRTLNNNGIIAMLGDQDAGANGVFIDFLNRPASMAQGVASFALKTKASILPTFTRRTDYSKHILEIGDTVEIINTGDKEKDVKANLKNITGVVEDYIKRFPDQWLWSHKRWKTTPQRTVLVLSDKKPGHFNQAMAVADMVEEALGARLKARGIKERALIKIHNVELEFKNRFTRVLLDLCSLFAGKRCQGSLKCLSFCLKKETFDEIKNNYADIVVSCGRSLVAANIFLKYENNAKNIVMMKPGLGRSRKFDLVVLPRHDISLKPCSFSDRIGKDEPRSPNLLVTEVAPNRVTEAAIERALTGLGVGVKKKGLGVLIGGDAKNFKLEKETVEKVIDGVMKIAEEKDLDVFVTTSRRTSREIDIFLKQSLKNNSRCKLLVIANEKNIDGIVPEIFGLSEIVIVSPDSVSMISEAASSGRYTVVFRTEKPRRIGERKITKHDFAILNLEAQDYIKSATPDEIYNTIKRILTERPEIKKLEDRKRIIEKLQGFI